MHFNELYRDLILLYSVIVRFDICFSKQTVYVNREHAVLSSFFFLMYELSQRPLTKMLLFLLTCFYFISNFLKFQERIVEENFLKAFLQNNAPSLALPFVPPIVNDTCWKAYPCGTPK